MRKEKARLVKSDGVFAASSFLPCGSIPPILRKRKERRWYRRDSHAWAHLGIRGKKTSIPEHSAFDHGPTSAQKLLQSDVPSGDTESLTSGAKTREVTAGQLQLQPGSGPHLASHREREGHCACPALRKLRTQPTPTAAELKTETPRPQGFELLQAPGQSRTVRVRPALGDRTRQVLWAPWYGCPTPADTHGQEPHPGSHGAISKVSFR